MTVLTPGVLLTVYLKTKGFHETVIAAFRGVSAVSGVLATIIAPYLFHLVGYMRGGLFSIWFQIISLTIGLGFVTAFDQQWAFYILMVMICLSRVSFKIY